MHQRVQGEHPTVQNISDGPASWRIRCRSQGSRSHPSCSTSHNGPIYWSIFGQPGLSRQAQGQNKSLYNGSYVF